jgi:LmbE family N-acetylglucosaminyl deacetylase
MAERGLFPPRVRLIPALAAALALTALSALRPAPALAQVRDPYATGAAGVLLQIEKLRTTASLLEVGAHPDDEDALVMARTARGDHARAAYLSLTRGEGGQNAIGSEQSDALGVIRTEELLQSRTLDGGAQYFTRAVDYGFSKSREEAARMWGESELLGDIVRVIRSFRPLVVYNVFSGTPSDGHGHHQFSAALTPLAFRAAADPAQYPEQLAQGLRPWRPLKLYRAPVSPPTNKDRPTTLIEGGDFDPLLGRSDVEIAAEGRSQQKTQSMGTPQMRGRLPAALVLVAPPPGEAAKDGSMEDSLFAGLDTSLAGIPALAGLPAGALKGELAAMDHAASATVDGYDALHPEKAVLQLREFMIAARSARAALKGLAGASPDAVAEADFLLGIKEAQCARAMQLASGTVIDAVSDVETPVAAESFNASVRLFIAQPALVKVTSVTLVPPQGWGVAPTTDVQRGPGNMLLQYPPERADRVDAFRLTVGAEAPPTQPYWLEQPAAGHLFAWPEGSTKGGPFAPPLVSARVEAEIGGVPVVMGQPLEFRIIDPVRSSPRTGSMMRRWCRRSRWPWTPPC